MDQTAGTCVPLPDAVAETPGVLTLPLGCDGIAGELVAPDEAELDAWWAYRCELPPADEDFDGIAGDCDLCPFSFDPTNQSYIDASGREWPKDGKYCNGEYSSEAQCTE
ncbi:MAG: hypothetical protein IAG13_32595 [Deltaproteobacteria bacterium]|nr:hypothetical protein [Nannocystaceae bacterium]